MSGKPDKREIAERIISKLEAERRALGEAARAAHEAATHPDSRAENAHDTRGLEASYLAGAQAARGEALDALITHFKHFPWRAFREGEAVAPGALVDVAVQGRRARYLFMAQGGGVSINLAPGSALMVVTPEAPLGEAMAGRRVGDTFEVDVQGATREYELLSIA